MKRLPTRPRPGSRPISALPHPFFSDPVPPPESPSVPFGSTPTPSLDVLFSPAPPKPNVVVVLMSNGADPIRSMSHEEDRVHEYLTAARITGRRRYPLHSDGGFECGVDMEDLAPDFQPVRSDESSGFGTPIGLQLTQKDQVEQYQSISCQAKFSGFSHEELRYADYLRGYHPPGNPHPTTTTTTKPGALDPALAPLDFWTTAEESVILTYMTISLTPEYKQHSLEELRLACYQAGRQLTSAETTAWNPRRQNVLMSLNG